MLLLIALIAGWLRDCSALPDSSTWDLKHGCTRKHTCNEIEPCDVMKAHPRASAKASVNTPQSEQLCCWGQEHCSTVASGWEWWEWMRINNKNHRNNKNAPFAPTRIATAFAVRWADRLLMPPLLSKCLKERVFREKTSKLLDDEWNEKKGRALLTILHTNESLRLCQYQNCCWWAYKLVLLFAVGVVQAYLRVRSDHLHQEEMKIKVGTREREREQMSFTRKISGN